MNYEEVALESKKNAVEKNYEVKKARAESKLKRIEDQKAAEAKGESYEAGVRLGECAWQVEDYMRKRKKKDPDPGFSDYAACHLRRYNKNIRTLRPDLERYSKLKASG